MNEKELLEYNIDRLDSYIEIADNKANFILALTSVLLVGLIFQSSDIVDIVNSSTLKVISIFVLLGTSILLIISSFFALKVILPRTPKSDVKSIFYFKDIATYNEEEYKNTIKSVLSKNDGVDDLRRQTLQLSKICSNKMDKIKLSFQFFIGSGIGVCIELAIVLITLY